MTVSNSPHLSTAQFKDLNKTEAVAKYLVTRQVKPHKLEWIVAERTLLSDNSAAKR